MSDTGSYICELTESEDDAENISEVVSISVFDKKDMNTHNLVTNTQSDDRFIKKPKTNNDSFVIRDSNDESGIVPTDNSTDVIELRIEKLVVSNQRREQLFRSSCNRHLVNFLYIIPFLIVLCE